jgi:hypothetical protein
MGDAVVVTGRRCFQFCLHRSQPFKLVTTGTVSLFRSRNANCLPMQSEWPANFDRPSVVVPVFGDDSRSGESPTARETVGLPAGVHSSNAPPEQLRTAETFRGVPVCPLPESENSAMSRCPGPHAALPCTSSLALTRTALRINTNEHITY